MKLKPLIIILMLGLTACDEEGVKPSVNKPVQEIDKNLYSINKPAAHEEVIQPKVEEPLPSIPVEFPQMQPLVREEQVRALRGRRQQAYLKTMRQEQSEKTGSFTFSDTDYQKWEPRLPEDKSTFPVDRSRILTADMRIGAVLEDNINSQIPGRVILVVDRDILSPNGKYVLLPAYTKIICGYEGLSQTGETRLPVCCSRVLRPDGVSIALTNAIASDQMGRTGLIGEVDNRVFERYGAAFIVSGISALAQSSVNQNQPPWVNNSANVLSNNLGQVTSEVIKQNLDLRPIISIKAGSRIQLIPQTDIILRKPIEVSP